MADGGLSCDEAAYLETDECPSSMVGTVAPFEGMLLGAPGEWTATQLAFLERAAGFLVDRRLMMGSQTQHNAAERGREGASITSWAVAGRGHPTPAASPRRDHHAAPVGDRRVGTAAAGIVVFAARGHERRRSAFSVRDARLSVERSRVDAVLLKDL